MMSSHRKRSPSVQQQPVMMDSPNRLFKSLTNPPMLQPSVSSPRIVSQKLRTAYSDLSDPERLVAAGPAGRSLSQGALHARMSPMIEPSVLARRGSTVEPRGSSKSMDTVSIATAGRRTQASVATTDTHVFDAHGQPIHNRAYEAHGLRFVPAEVIFYNAFRGQCYTTLISISNISCHLLHLSISQPFSSAFHIKDDGTRVALAPGLSINRKIIFKCAEGALFDSVIPIRIHQSLVLLPIKVIPGQVHVMVEPSVLNFGRIDLGSAFVSRTVTLLNRGSISARYAIDMSKNELDIMITKRTGSIKPFGSVEIKVQLSGLVVGEHETEFWVKSTPASRFIVRVTVVVPFLMAVHPFATEEFTLLDLAPCFPGTQRYETFLIRNSSSDTSAVVVLAERDGHVVPPEIAAQDDLNFRYFKLCPSDGTLAPFESRIFTLWFTPRAPSLERGWKRPTAKERSAQYLCFFRVQRVTVTNFEDTEPIKASDEARKCQLDHMQPEESFSLSTNMTSARTIKSSMSTSEFDNEEKNNIIRVCAYSIALSPILHIVPDELKFGNVKIGQKVNKVLRLYNPCELPLGFSYVKQAHLTVCPSTAQFLQPKKSIEVTVQLHPRSLQFEQKRLVFDLISFRNLTDEKHLTAIGQVSVKLDITVEVEAPAVIPQFLPGITPRTYLEGEEVGLHTELVLFSSNCPNIPKAVVWPKPTLDKPWLKSNARVAFPNELRRSLRVTAHDGNARSIFTGQPRYNVPDDPDNVYSPQELEFRKKEANKYKGFVKEQAEAKIKYFMHLDGEDRKPEEYEVSDQKLYKLLGSQPALPPPELKPDMTHPVPYDVLGPLSPLQLFNIKVQPQVIDFGKMPPKTDCSTTIAVDNMNCFPISVRFKSYKESLKVHGGSFIVPSQSTCFQKITLHLDTTGKHYTNISYIINTYHSYDMKVSADVEVRSLILDPGELTFRGQSEREIFERNILPVKLINPLGSPTFFKWNIPTGSPFGVVPVSGMVPSRSSLQCSVFLNMKNGNVLGSVLILKVDEGTHSHFPVNFIPSEKFTLTLFSPKISCPNIPLGVEYDKKIIIYNHGRRLSFFSIDDRSLPKGVKVRPYTGMIKARSCFTLSVKLLFTEIKKFSFKIPISSLSSKSVVFTCYGFVTYPLVTYKPRSILFRKTPVHSHSCTEFQIQNECQGEVTLKFLMNEFSQFKISTSSDFSDEAANLRNRRLMLTSQESRSLYLHFEPHDIAGYAFLLPVLINDILGPPTLSNPLSQHNSQYISSPADDTITANKIPGMAVPEMLESIRVDVAVQRGFIKCNSFNFEFFKTDVKEKGGHSLVIENIHPKIPVTIRIQHPDSDVHPFSVSGRHGYVSYEEPIVLEPKETVELNIMFVPLLAGTYATGVPIYVDEFSQAQPYTTIKMTGVFYRSSLTCTSNMVNFIPVDVDVEIDKVIRIIANHQPEDTKLSITLVDSMNAPLDHIFTIVYPETDQIPYGIDNFVVYVKIKFRSEVPRSVIAFLTATDGYDGECKVTITAIADRSTLTTHAFHFMNSLSKIPRMKPPKPEKSSPAHSSSPDKRLLALQNLERVIDDTNDGEDLFLTTAIVEEIEQYPLFPKSSSDTEYAVHMRRTKESMEDWLYEQGLQGKYRMTIGEDYYFSEPFQNAVNSTNKNARFEDVKSVIDLITKLTGREFTAQYPLPPNCPVDKIGRIDFAVQAFKSVVLFLNRQGGHLIHVSPIYLLDYDDYVLYHEKLKPAHLDGPSSLRDVSQLDVGLQKEVYVRLSIQCWLDVFLQLYKVLVFYPSMMESRKRSTVEAIYSSPVPSVEERRTRNAAKHPQAQVVAADLENGEDSLLAWLDNIFAQDRPSCVPPRKITNFTEDLRDGVVLAIITARFCPFLNSYLTDLFWTPSNKAECEQNVGVLSLAWSAVKIGLSFTAQEMISPHPVKMLTICCLLYSVLPTYRPTETLIFEACLADNVNKQLKITNPSSHPIGFSIKKFDPNNCFSMTNVKNNFLKIAGNSSQILDINFFAKFVNKVTATLVLCGNQVAGGYASNMVFNLKGMPAKLQHKIAFNITCPLYKVSKVKNNLNSPFATEGEFSLCITEVEPKSSTAKKQKPWSQVSQRKMIRSLYIAETTMTVPPVMDIPTTLTVIASALQLKNKDFWIIFSNSKIGEFVVKVTIIPDLTAPQYILHPPYPIKVCSGSNKEGACDNPTCLRVVQVQIPSKNFRLWNAAKSMLSNTLNKKEKTFWDGYLETGLGLKLLGWIAGQYHIGQNDMNFLFQQTVRYKVECNSPLVTCPPEITIEDVHSDDPVDLPVHLNIGAKAGLAVDIKLRAENELRHYQVVFYRKKSGRLNKSQLSSVLSPSKSHSQTHMDSTIQEKKTERVNSKPVCCEKNYFGDQS